MAKKEKLQINWLQVVIIFLLGVLIASNVFLISAKQNNEMELDKLVTEIDKLKKDDIALAQVINNLISQLQISGVIAKPLNNNSN